MYSLVSVMSEIHQLTVIFSVVSAVNGTYVL